MVRLDGKILVRQHEQQQHTDRKHEEIRQLIADMVMNATRKWGQQLDGVWTETAQATVSQETRHVAAQATRAADAAAAAAAAGVGTGGAPAGMGGGTQATGCGRPGDPPQQTLDIAGFDRDTPANHIEAVTRAWLRAFPCARDAFTRTPPDGRTAPAPAAFANTWARARAPYLLGSVCHFETDGFAASRRLLHELRSGPSAVVRTYRLRAAFVTSRDERYRNRVAVVVAAAVQARLWDHCEERSKEPWVLVCWRCMTIFVRGRRVCTLTRDPTHVPQFHSQWWRKEDYTAAEDDVVRAATKAHRLTAP